MEASVLRQSATILLGLLLIGATERTLRAQTDSGTYIMRSNVEATTAEGLKRLQESGRSISDLMIRHVDVGEENLGVAVVQRTAREAGGELRGIVHVELDEIYYVLSGEGTMVTGGEIEGVQIRDSSLLGPIGSGVMTARGDSRDLKSGDIVIVPKGVPHAWSEITTETITYLVFRTDPQKVMNLK